MERTPAQVNGSKLLISIKIMENGGNFKAIANVNFGWFEVIGFRISYFKDYTRRNDLLSVEPPKYGKFYKEAFRTTVAVKDEKERDRIRKEYWYQLEDAIIDAYYWAQDQPVQKEPDKTGEKQATNTENNTEEEINLDDLPF